MVLMGCLDFGLQYAKLKDYKRRNSPVLGDSLGFYDLTHKIAKNPRKWQKTREKGKKYA